MRVKVGKQKAAKYVICEGHCRTCAFHSKSLYFCISMNCAINGSFDRTGTLEDVFKL